MMHHVTKPISPHRFTSTLHPMPPHRFTSSFCAGFAAFFQSKIGQHRKKLQRQQSLTLFLILSHSLFASFKSSI